MKIKNDKTGQVIDVSEDQLANYGIRAQDASQNTGTVQQASQSGGLADNVGNVLINILKGAAAPFVNTGQRVAGAGYELGRAGDMGIASLLDKLGSKELANKFNQSASQTNPYLSKQEDINKATSPLQIAKDSAGILSYGVPVKGASVASTFGKGAVAGGLAGFSQSGDSVSNMVGNTALGGLVGGVGGAALEKLLGLGKGATQAGETLEKGVLNPESVSGKGLNSFANEQELLGIKQKYNLSGSVQEQRAQVDTIQNGLKSKLNNVLENSTAQAPADKITQAFKQDVLDNGANFIESNASHNSIMENELSLLNKKANNGVLGAKDVADFKFQIAQKLGPKPFDIASGAAEGALNDKQAVLLDMWNSADKILTDMAPEAKEVTTQLSELHRISPALKNAMNKGGVNLPFVGRVGQGVTQGIGDKTSQVLKGTGTSLDKILGKIPAGASNQVAVQGANLITRPNETNQSNNVSNNTTVPDINALTNQSSTQQNTSGIPTITSAALQQARLALSDKSYAKIKELYDLQQSNTGGGTKATAKDVNTAKSASASLDQLDTILKGDPDKLAKALLPGAIGARDYEAAARNVLDGIARLRTGAAMSKSEEAFYKSYLPSVLDPPKVRAQKIQQLKDYFDSFGQ